MRRQVLTWREEGISNVAAFAEQAEGNARGQF